MRSIFICLFLTLSSQLAYAFAISNERTHAFGNEGVSAYRELDGALTLTGENCDLLKRHVSALSSWKKKLNELPTKPTSSCTCNSLRCYMNVDSVSPTFIEQYHAVDAGRWGPNCWNSVLVSSKILPVLRFTPPEEMNFWMSSPLCRQIPESETPEPGDIVAIRRSYQDEVHAFIFITEELSFSKNYLMTTSPYRLQSTTDIFSIYPVSFSCRHKVGNPRECQTYATYYRCSTFTDYISEKKISFSSRYIELESMIREVEHLVSKIAFEWKYNLPLQKSSPQLLKEARAKLDSIQAEVTLRSRDMNSSSDQRLLWDALRFRIIGTQMSIDWI